jgi:hypothetical protein
VFNLNLYLARTLLVDDLIKRVKTDQFYYGIIILVHLHHETVLRRRIWCASIILYNEGISR